MIRAAVKKAEVAGATCILLVTAAIVFLLVGPVYQTSGVSCSSSGSCVTSGGTESLRWSSILLVPLIAAGLVLAGSGLNRWSKLSLPVTSLGCLALAGVTFLGLFSIGSSCSRRTWQLAWRCSGSSRHAPPLDLIDGTGLELVTRNAFV
jgi:hypothetical protein